MIDAAKAREWLGHVTIDATKSKHPDGKGFTFIYAIYNTTGARKLVGDKILAPGQSDAFDVHVGGTYEADSFGVDENARWSYRLTSF